MRKRSYALRRAALSALLITGSSIAFAGSAIAQEADAATEDQAAPDENAIVVSGIRASLENAARDKETADQIKDVISAEDIGKLPDTNVAEAMQRVTGVQINRDQGEGSEIAVRGFSQNRVEVNGQTQLGAGENGAVSYNSIPSEAFKSIEVIKTPSASDIEGSLGATIRFNTRQPLDRGGRLVVAASAQGQYAERADAWSPNVSLLVSKGWDVGDGGRFGALLSYTRKDRKLRQDFFDVRGWEAVNGIGKDLDGDGIIGENISRDPDTGTILDLQDGVYVPLQTRIRVTEQDRSLQSWTTALQYQTADGAEVYFNGTYSRNRDSDLQYQATANFTNAVAANAVTGPALGPQYANRDDLIITDNQTVTQAFLGYFNNRGIPQGVGFNLSGASNPVNRDVFTAQLGAKFGSGPLKVHAELSGGFGKQLNPYINSVQGISGADRPFFYYDFGTGSDIPTLLPSASTLNGTRVTEYDPNAIYDLTNVGLYTSNNISQNLDRRRNHEIAGRIDFDLDLGSGFLRSLEFGARVGVVHAERYRDRAEDKPGDADGTFGGRSFTSLQTLEPGLVIGLPYDDLLAGATGDFFRTFYLLNPQYLRENVDDIFARYGITYAADPTFGFKADRTDLAAYVKGNFSFDAGSMPVSGNVGVRAVRTSRTASGPTPIRDANGVYSIVTSTSDYDYTEFLPSFNAVAQPADRFYVRFGAARAMARPDITDVAPYVLISDSFDRARGGNPSLKPQVVDQVDLSIEKYWGRSNLVSLALFYKHFEQRIEDGITELCLPIGPTAIDVVGDCPLDNYDRTRLEQPQNFGGANVKGFEVGFQQGFDFLPSPLDGFGVIANYTYVDASGGSISATGAQLPVQDLSKHSYNLIGYYEKGGFEARVAYNWRSKFFDDRTDTNQASFAEPYGQLDASIGYDVTKNISITAEAVNLLNTPEIRYQELRERLLSYRVNDRRFLFGIRIKN